MLAICIVATGPYRVTQRSTGVDLLPTDEPLAPGHYDIRPYSRRDKIYVSEELCITRVLSKTITGRDDFFRARVRERDKKCVITGTVNPEVILDEWSGFEAAHIFPLSSEEHWIQQEYSECITNKVSMQDTGINSCQNGLLMLSNVHQKFDSYRFSINPDDGYKITCFDLDAFNIGGRTLDPICRESESEVGARDQLLRWHFRQAVLANMRGAGEPSFELDFPPGGDHKWTRTGQTDGSRALFKAEWDFRGPER
ncbi:HNH endonuclease-domain-containing protein [Lipomyces kononenkoae]|uniref:HNH endonuclease-domain-containing protein n=1 Tax=Lipomyces kononenkoae TaxID=34357 RepID=A0ACC3SQV4_LIPKO